MMRKDSYQRRGLQGKQTCSSLTHHYLLVQWTLSSQNSLSIFNSLAVQVSGTIALVLDRNSASHLSVKQYHKPIQSEQLQPKACSKRAPVLYEKYKKLHGVPLRISCYVTAFRLPNRYIYTRDEAFVSLGFCAGHLILVE